jgi:uncharacterized protein YbjT (DUF2867 family)
VQQRLVVRDPSRVERLPGVEVVEFGGYGDDDGVRDAFAGVSTLFGSSISRSSQPGPEATFTFARDHYDTEQYFRASVIPFTFSRQSLYAYFLPLLGGEDGVIRGPAGDGRFAPVLPDDWPTSW